MQFQDDEMLDTFLQESEEHLAFLEEDLLKIESDPEDSNTINKVFRSVHSIKGTAGFFGLKNITELAHIMENLMSLARDGKLLLSKVTVEALLQGTDKLKDMIDNISESENINISNEVALIQKIIEKTPLDEILPKEVEEIEKNEIIDIQSDFPELTNFVLDPITLSRSIKENKNIYKLYLFLHKDLEDNGQSMYDAFQGIISLGSFIDSYIDISSITGFNQYSKTDLSCQVLFSTHMMPDLIANVFNIPKEQITDVNSDILKWLAIQKKTSNHNLTQNENTQELEDTQPQVQTVDHVTPQLTDDNLPVVNISFTDETNTEKNTAPSSQNLEKITQTQQNEHPTPTNPALSKKKADETIRVAVPVLNDLMNLAGEMVLNRNQLLLLTEKVKEDVPNLSHLLQNINRVTSELQEKIMQTRLQEVGAVFNKFTRVIRDLSTKLNKEIEIDITGKDVELDRSIIESLSDPLTHIIRNAADHAIEDPDTRDQIGKNRTGLIKLSAKHSGGQVHIEIKDDGKGLDAELLKRKAIEKALLDPTEIEHLSTQEIHNLIFHPGFSTAEKLSDISGRGVGMDVVKTNIEKMGGTIELESEKGVGTTVLLKLPLTLAIIPAMVVGDSNCYFAVPQVNLEEVVLLGGKYKLESIHGNPTLRLRDNLLPLVSLEKILKNTITDKDSDLEKLELSTEELHALEEDECYVLVLKTENLRYGLIVREIHDNEEIVVKPLSSFLKKAYCYSGETIMGDGKIAMILDTTSIANIAHLKFRDTNLTKEQAKENTTQHTNTDTQQLLLFENSPGEQFAINLAMISRIEKIKVSEIETTGNKQYLKYQESSLRIIKLQEFMSVKNLNENTEYLYVIVPKLVKKPIGIIASNIIDVVYTNVVLDKSNITGACIFGSAILNNKITLFLDIYKLFEAADPEFYNADNTIPNSFKNKRVLFAEDTAFFRAVTTNYLNEFGFVTDVANDGLEAWNKINQNNYDILLTDIEMPNMNGIELTSKVRHTDRIKDIPIVALTSLTTDFTTQNIGFTAHERKLDKNKLKDTLERVLNN